MSPSDHVGSVIVTPVPETSIVSMFCLKPTLKSLARLAGLECSVYVPVVLHCTAIDMRWAGAISTAVCTREPWNRYTRSVASTRIVHDAVIAPTVAPICSSR